jgi:hypothetical protein
MTTEKPSKQASDLVSYQLRSRTVQQSAFQPQHTHYKPQTIDEKMATGGERKVTVTAESHESDKDVKFQDQMLQLTTQLDQLRMDLRRVNELNRELTEKNKELEIRTRAKIVSDSMVARKPFLGKTAEQDPVDWLLWFEKYRGYKKMSDDVAHELFVMLMQGAAADWMNAQLADSVREPSLDRLTDSFKSIILNLKNFVGVTHLRFGGRSNCRRKKFLIT